MNCLGSECFLHVSNDAVRPNIEWSRIGGIGRESHLKREVLGILRSGPSFIFVAVIKHRKSNIEGERTCYAYNSRSIQGWREVKAGPQTGSPVIAKMESHQRPMTHHVHFCF